MTSALVVETSVSVRNNNSFQNYTHQDNHTRQSTFLYKSVIFFISHRVIELNHGNVPITFKQFESLVNRLESPVSCVPDVDQDLFGTCVTPIDDNHDEMYGVPAYEALVLDEEERECGEWVGGETEALRRLKLLEKEVSAGGQYSMVGVVEWSLNGL